jgi:hypothetical protein
VALADVARAAYAAQVALAVRAEKQASQVWGELDPEALSASWQSIGAADRLLVAVSVAQLTAAASADPYVAAAVATQGVTEPAEAAIGQRRGLGSPPTAGTWTRCCSSRS